MARQPWETVSLSTTQRKPTHDPVTLLLGYLPMRNENIDPAKRSVQECP